MKFVNLTSDLISIKGVDEWIEITIPLMLCITIAKSERRILNE